MGNFTWADRISYAAGLLGIGKAKSFDGGDWSTGGAIELIRGSKASRGRRSVQETLVAYETSPWFRAVVERVAYAAAIVPWRLFTVKGARPSKEDGEHHAIRHIPLQEGASLDIREKLMAKLDASGRLVEVTDHKLLEMLADPNPVLTGLDTRLVTFALLIVAGECGWALTLNSAGAPESLWVIPPHWITQIPGTAGNIYRVQAGGKVFDFPPEEFILFKNPSLVNPYGRGSGIGTSLADELETDEYIAKFQTTWFHSRGRPDLVVAVKPAPGGEGTTEPELRAAKERFENEYRGSDRGGRSMWTRGDMTITELKQKFVDLDLTQQRTWIKDLIQQVVGAPPEIMGVLENSNRATITEALAILAIVTTVPQLERFRAQAQQKIVPKYDPRLALGYESPVPTDREFQLKAVQVAPWAATRGEIRKLQGHEDRGAPDNIHVMPMGLAEEPAPPLPRERRVRSHMELLTKAVTPADIDLIVDSLTPEYLDLKVTPEIETTIEEWGNKTLAAVGVAPNFNMLNPLVTRYLDKFSSEQIVGINDTTKDLVRQALVAGTREGEGADELARRLRDGFSQFSLTRSATIARTEVTTSANHATWAAHKMSGVVDDREWLSTLDDRTRDNHALLHGQQAGLDEQFESVDGDTAMYPGGFGLPENNIQCRCTTFAVITEPKIARVDWIKGFVEDTGDDEKRVMAATQGVFLQQLDDVLAELRKVA